MTILLAIVAQAALAAPPPDLDAVAAAPRHHRVLLENDEVRVLAVEVGPGETEPVHEHRWPSVMLIRQPQPLEDILYRPQGGKLVEVGRRTIPAGPSPPALYGGPEAPHAIHNLGKGPFRATRIELKRPANAPPLSRDDDRVRPR